MPMAVSPEVHARNNIGRFIADIEGAATSAISEIIQEGEEISRSMAPVGAKPDFRTITLDAGFFSAITGRTSGVWGNSARHALYQEKGTGPHTMTGNPSFHFFWESAGRWWKPGLFGEPDIINHPGNPGVHFLQNGYDAMRGRTMRILDKHYPG